MSTNTATAKQLETFIRQCLSQNLGPAEISDELVRLFDIKKKS